MSWKEVQEEMDKIEQIVESLETEDDKLEKGPNESEVENEGNKLPEQAKVAIYVNNARAILLIKCTLILSKIMFEMYR